MVLNMNTRFGIVSTMRSISWVNEVYGIVWNNLKEKQPHNYEKAYTENIGPPNVIRSSINIAGNISLVEFLRRMEN